jgi:hypothetical protein
MSCWLTGVNFGIYYVNEVRRPAQSNYLKLMSINENNRIMIKLGPSVSLLFFHFDKL